ncbi:porin [Herbaspirillum sp. SJZ107]|uniref:porin n=1 Tax=Herbaspirillum sp. SJZ107 TaxID=2572881 RepID=UPI0011528953|nr:porin [Herbaspirillum sp. SJZ107]TQK03486.1 putative porin [Herbaspirillum sp. SJZ107]
MKIEKNKAVLAAVGAAACLLCADAAAQQSVEIYGLIGAYVGSVKRSGEPRAVTQLNGGGLTTSFLGFRGTEDLGGANHVIWSLESFYRPDTGEQGRNATDPFWSRNAWVGVEGDFGRITLGRQTNPMYSAMLQLSPFGTSVVFSPLALQTFVPAYGSNVLGDTVWNNVIRYSTTNLNGFRASADYGLGEQSGRPGVANLGLHANYNSGKWSAAVSAQRLRVNINTPLPVEQKAYLAGVAYNFGPVKVYGNVGHASIERGNSSRIVDLGLSVPMGERGTVMLESAHTRLSPAQAAVTHRNTSSLGYDYRLSKRTDVYLIHTGDKKSNAGYASTNAFGIRHLF